MPKLYTAANSRMVAFDLEDGGIGYQPLQDGYSDLEARYIAIIFGLNNYYLAWNNELDERAYDIDTEELAKTGEVEFAAVPKPSVFTPRPLPPPVLVYCDNEVVVKQLSREFHIDNDRIRKLTQQIWNMCQNVDVKFQWVRRDDNLAEKILK